MAIVRQSTERPVIGEMRKIGGYIKEWTGSRWVILQQVRKQKYTKREKATA